MVLIQSEDRIFAVYFIFNKNANMKVQKLKVDKIASVVVNLHLGKYVSITDEVIPEVGNVCIVKALEEKRVYDRLELESGRMAKVSKGDVIIGALGERMALQGFVGIVPEVMKKGDILNILNLGGVMGKAISYNREYGQPLEVEVLGMAFRDSKILNIKDDAIKKANNLMSKVPIIVVSGTSMNSGKTEVASKVIQELTWKGYRVCSAKVSGIAALKDILIMEDHGSVKSISFLDFGYPSTVNSHFVPNIAKGAVNKLISSYNPDVIVIELGDGIFGNYGVWGFFMDDELKKGITCNIVCAIDPVGAWGISKMMKKSGIKVHLVSGPVTDNSVGIDFIKDKLNIMGINAFYQKEELGNFVEKVLIDCGNLS